MTVSGLDRVAVTRYVTPLREGGSLPGIVEGDDLGTYVCKFRGAGQGVRVLVAEVVVAGIARRLGLRTPRLVALELDASIARYEADEEVQDLLVASVGLNLGVDFLPGAFGVDDPSPLETTRERRREAATVLWLDALTANVDRSWRNPNLLWWHDDLWVIDHGASLYFHHGWAGGIGDAERFARQPWSVADHVLERFLPELVQAPGLHDELASRLAGDAVPDILADVPDAWLESVPGTDGPDDVRAAYAEFLAARLASRSWLPGQGDA